MRIILLATALFLLSCAVRAQQTDSLIPSALIVPDQYKALFDSAHTVLLPKGFTCTVFYANKNWSPRALAIRPDGVVCVSDNGNSVIDALPDANQDNVADSAIALATNDSNSHGFAFYNGALYTASYGDVRKYEHPNGLGIYQDSSVFIGGIPYLPEGTPNHVTRTILFDTVGQSLYLSVGAPCNACREVAQERAAILRFNLDGTGRRIYASGLRNAVGLTMDNVTHTLWASVAERNSQGEDVPQEFAAKIVDHGFYGWPIAYGDHQWDNFSADSEYRALLPITHADSSAVQSMQVAEMYFPAHTTPLGIASYHSANFPGYDGDLFITLHGSYPAADGRLIADGSKIERARNINGAWLVTDFASGFLTDSINYKRWARPCGIVIDTAGDLYFTSDHTDPHTPPAVYKISYVGDRTVSYGAPAKASLSLFPDPASGNCQVDIKGLSGKLRLTVYDVLGNVVLATSDMKQSNHSFNTDRLSNGSYLVRVEGIDGVLTRKIVVQR